MYLCSNTGMYSVRRRTAGRSVLVWRVRGTATYVAAPAFWRSVSPLGRGVRWPHHIHYDCVHSSDIIVRYRGRSRFLAPRKLKFRGENTSASSPRWSSSVRGRFLFADRPGNERDETGVSALKRREINAQAVDTNYLIPSLHIDYVIIMRN